MYTYIKSSCLVRTIGTRWTDDPIADTPLSEIYSRYLRVYIEVHTSISDENFIVDMETYRTQLCASGMTLQEWLTSMGGTPLHRIDHFPSDDLTSVHYENIIQRGYKITPVKAGYDFPPETPRSELPDLQLTRPGYPTDLTLIHSHCLASVNGYFHRTDTDGTKAFILDGGVTSNMQRCSHTGLLSFMDIGEVKTYQLKDEDIMPVAEGEPLANGLIIRIPEEYVQWAKLFIFGGYLMQPEPESVFQIADDLWVIQPKSIPLVERYFESRVQIDMSSIKTEATLTNEDTSLLKESLYTDENIRAWLQMSQSFIAFVDTPELYVERIYLRVSNLPGFITSYQEPNYPTIMGYGKMVEYSKVKEVNFWALRVQDPFYRQYAFQKAPISVQPVLTNHLLPWKPYERTQGYMLRISGKKI